MKHLKKNFVILLLSLLYTHVAVPSITSDPVSPSNESEDVPVRALNATSSTIFGKALAFSSQSLYTQAITSYYFLGAQSSGQGDEAFSRAYIDVDTTTNPATQTLQIKGIAPTVAYVNGATETSANPVHNKAILDITMKGDLPVLLLEDQQTLALIIRPSDGSCVYTNTETINDANGDPTSEVVDIEGASNYIFAAVAPTGDPFGDANSGIAMLASGRSLDPLDAQEGTTGNLAAPLPSTGSNNATNDHVAMFWDPNLKRLFIGLHVISRGGAAVGHGLLVGRLESKNKPKLILESATPDSVYSGNNQIIGFSGDPTNGVKIHAIRTMHNTSTGKSYIIVNGKVYTGTIDKRDVFAIPMIQREYPCSNLSENAGKVADKDSITQIEAATTPADMVTETDPAAIVGAGPAPADVEKMFVPGNGSDAVYVCCAHASDPSKQGIFHSQAIFDKNGLIRAWTPWQRVMGAVTPVLSADLDLLTTSYWYLHKTTNPGDTVGVTRWNVTDTNLLGNLINKLPDTFTQDSAGIHQIFNFDEKTPSFETDEFSMMVATGHDTVALIQTGKDTTAFIPTAGDDFGTNYNTFVRVFNDNVVAGVGPVCCAEVSRSTDSDRGWLFIGGHNGVAVLRQSALTGIGWSSLDDVILSGYSFMEIGNFSHVQKLVCDDTYLFILTPSALYRVTMDAGKFKDNPDPLNPEILAQPGDADLNSCCADDALLDFVVSSKLGILATTCGLYRTSNGNDITGSLASAMSWEQVSSAAGYNFGPINMLYPKSITKGTFAEGGNLYALAGNMSTQLATIVRFDIEDTRQDAIDDDTVIGIIEQKSSANCPTRDYFYPVGTFRSGFATDGTFGYHALSKHFDKKAYLRMILMATIQATVRNKELAPPLNLDNCAFNVGNPVQNTASGSWFIPGDWGVRIHE